MGRRNPPAYRLHGPSGQAVVTLNGRDFYLGSHGTPKSRDKYDRLISEWLAAGRQIPNNSDLTVNELLLAYLRFAKGHYPPPSNELAHIKWSLRPLKRLCGTMAAHRFGPLALKSVREEMIDAGLCRREINKRIGRIKRLFAWAVENEIVPPSVHHGLSAVRGLRAGRSRARESEPVKAVPDAFVDAIKPYVLPPVWAIVELQRLTGARPGEICRMRSIDVDTTGRVWLYKPTRHKTQHYGYERIIALGPRAQEILRPWLRTDLEAPLFSPREAMERRAAELRARRKTKVQPSQQNRKKTKPRRQCHEMYDTRTYAHAISRACKKAEVPHWHPHQLRHNAATWLRKEFGLDVARVVLGHHSPRITELYAELDTSRAIEAMASFG